MKNFRSVLVLSILSIVILCGSLFAGPGDVVTGAGASFPFPLYSQWAYQYNQLTQTQINYQSIGSGGGMRQIKQGTVDFAGSDAPMKVDEQDEFQLIQFPTVLGGVVPVINLKGISKGSIKLDGPTLVNIYLGNIKKWDDKAIRDLNPGVKLPKRDITVVHRSDGSGTTWIFTSYLSAISAEWTDKVGVSTSVSWPTGVGGKGNEGVAAYVQRIEGAIGYVEYAYALLNNMNHIQLKNREGNYVSPSVESFQDAAANADWNNAPGFYMLLVNQPGRMSWPITGTTYILMNRTMKDEHLGKVMLEFWDWCFNHGTDKAVELHYVPLPKSLITMIRNEWKKQIKSPSGKPIW